MTLASGQDAPEGIVVDTTNVYWTVAGAIMTMPRCGGAPVMLADGGTSDGIALGSGRVYWTGFGAGSQGNSDGLVAWVPISGGTSTTLITGQDDPRGIAVDDDHVYWVNEGTIPGLASSDPGSNDESPSDGTVMRMSLDGAETTVLTGGQDGPTAIALDAANVYWVTFGDYGSNDGTVMSMPLGAAGDPVMLASVQDGPVGVAVTPTQIYWANGNGPAVATMPLSGGTPTIVDGWDAGAVPMGGWNATGVVVDSTSVYWTGLGYVMKAPLTGGPSTILASGQDVPTGITVDAYSVYWVNQGTGSYGATGAVMKLTPK